MGIAGIANDTEARVTKEVAEATLPYLMEAAGILQAQQTSEQHAAIISMIYTDEGQQQMVEWAKNNKRPTNLAVFGGLFSDDQQWEEHSSNKEVQIKDAPKERLFRILFPCQTDTFTSFANHPSRFGRTVLMKYEAVKTKLIQWIKDGRKPRGKEGNDIAEIGDTLDCKLARVIFILDILDDLQQVKEVCETIPTDIACTPSQNEYMCRPVSAIIANKEGTV